MRPGEVYRVDRGPGGKPRLVVVVSREALNRGDYAVVVPFTTRRFEERRSLPNCVPFEAGEFCFTQDCVAQAEQVSFVERHLLAGPPEGRLDPAALARIGRAVGDVIGCTLCELADDGPAGAS